MTGALQKSRRLPGREGGMQEPLAADLSKEVSHEAHYATRPISTSGDAIMHGHLRERRAREDRGESKKKGKQTPTTTPHSLPPFGAWAGSAKAQWP